MCRDFLVLQYCGCVKRAGGCFVFGAHAFGVCYFVFDLSVVMRLLGDCVCASSSVFILLGESSCLWFLVRFLCLGLLLLLCLMGLPFLSVWGMIFGLLLFLLVLGGGVGFEVEVVLDAVLLFCLGLS